VNPPSSGAIQTVVQGSIAIMKKPKLEVGTKCPIAMVDVVIEKLIGADPSPPTKPTTLPNLIHTTDTMATDAINIQPCIVVVHNVEQNVGHDDTASKSMGTSTPHSPVGVPVVHVGEGLDVMEMLWNMPNSETLKELLEFSTVFAQMCRE
jgi:hypothetical protein